MLDRPTARCPVCQAENPATQKFCGECGARLPLVCPACAHPNPAGQKFCGECGTQLGAAAAPPPAGPIERLPVLTPTEASAPAAPQSRTGPGAAFREAAPEAYTPKHLAEKILSTRGTFEGERKLVTVLFSDVSGFTAMSERLDPEEVHSIMDRVFEITLAEVHHYEGTVNQFLGDGVMALFGAPIAHEDHPHRALGAALAIQDALAPLKREVRRQHGLKFRMRMGLNTGLVVVGAIGRDLRMDYTAVGDTTNLAARLLGVAGPGQIVASATTKQLTEGFFVFEDLGEFTLKGKSRPIRAYEVKTALRGRTRLEVSRERGLTPLGGRQREMDCLTGEFRHAAAGQASVVLLVGEPGVGKSRLLYEWLHRLDGHAVVELEATCFSHMQAIPFAPILQLLRRHLGLGDGATETETRERVANRLQALGMQSEELAVLFAHFLGASAAPEFLARLSAAQLKERTFEALRAVLLRAGGDEPLILVIDDLHWIDASSEEFLRYLVGELPGRRVLLLLSTRPGPIPSWLDVPMRVTIAVEGLDPDDVQRMIRTLLGSDAVASDLVRVLLEKGEGNPLFVEEIVRQLRETGGIVVEGGEARLHEAKLHVPETIHDIIAARIDRLAEAVKQTLQVASVVGREFAVPLVSRVLQINGALASYLRDLHVLDFVFPSRPGPEPVYSFKHALTQEVAYGGLLERRRRLYHASVGLALEEFYAGRLDEVVELLAYQFGRSGEDEKAVDYAILAAEKAQRRWANTEALAHFAAAAKRLETMPDTEPNRLRRIDAVVKQGEIMFALGRHAEHIEALDEIRDIVRESADSTRRAAWCYWAGFLHSIAGSRPEVSIAYCREALAIADAASLDDIKAFAECCLTHVYAMAGSLREAVEAGEHALPAFEARGNVWWACRTLWGLSIATIYLGEWERSLDCCRRALEHGEAVNDRRIRVVSGWRLGWTHIQRGDWETGVRCCQEALALSPSPLDAAMAKAAQGYGMVRLGQVQAGTEQLAEAVAWFDRSHLHLTRSSFGVWLGDSYILQGELVQAREVLEKVLATSRELGYRHLEGMAHRLLGQSLVDEAPGAAARHLETAVEILRDVGARNEYAKGLVAQADLRRAAGDPAEARRLLHEAASVFAALGTLDEPRRVETALSMLGDRSLPA